MAEKTMRRGGINDYVGGWNWRVEIDNVSMGAFQEVSGLTMEMEVLEYQDGDDLFLRKRPGRKKFNNITLKKGYIDNVELRKWWENTMNGVEDRRSMVIELQDNIGNAVCSWELTETWPCKWKVNNLEGKGTSAFAEEVEIVVENVIYKAG